VIVIWGCVMPAIVLGHSPGGAGKECALVSNSAPAAISVEFQERLLGRIFGVVGIEQHGVGYAKDKARLALDQRCELRFFVAGQSRVPRMHRKTEGMGRVFGFVLGAQAGDRRIASSYGNT
jgi:hypothetical protein